MAPFAREAAVLRYSRLSHRLAVRRLEGRRWLALEWFPGVDAATAAGELRRRAAAQACWTSAGPSSPPTPASTNQGILTATSIPGTSWLTGTAASASSISACPSGPALPSPPPRAAPASGSSSSPSTRRPSWRASPRPPSRRPASSTPWPRSSTAARRRPDRDFHSAGTPCCARSPRSRRSPSPSAGAEPWPEVEAVLARALAQGARGAISRSLADLRAALRAVEIPAAPDRSVAAVPLPRPCSPASSDGSGSAGPLFREGCPSRPWPPSTTAPPASPAVSTASLWRGRTPGYSALADLWAQGAARGRGDEGDYKPTSRGDHPGRRRPGPSYHTASGVHAVRALIARAHGLGDELTRREAMGAFLAAAGGALPNPDLTLGRSGVLLAGGAAPGASPGERSGADGTWGTGSWRTSGTRSIPCLRSPRCGTDPTSAWPTAGPASSTPPCAGAGRRPSPAAARSRRGWRSWPSCALPWGRGPALALVRRRSGAELRRHGGLVQRQRRLRLPLDARPPPAGRSAATPWPRAPPGTPGRRRTPRQPLLRPRRPGLRPPQPPPAQVAERRWLARARDLADRAAAVFERERKAPGRPLQGSDGGRRPRRRPRQAGGGGCRSSRRKGG